MWSPIASIGIDTQWSRMSSLSVESSGPWWPLSLGMGNSTSPPTRAPNFACKLAREFRCHICENVRTHTPLHSFGPRAGLHTSLRMTDRFPAHANDTPTQLPVLAMHETAHCPPVARKLERVLTRHFGACNADGLRLFHGIWRLVYQSFSNADWSSSTAHRQHALHTIFFPVCGSFSVQKKICGGSLRLRRGSLCSNGSRSMARCPREPY